MKRLTGWFKQLKKPEKVLLVIGMVLALGAIGGATGQPQPKPAPKPAKHQSAYKPPVITYKTVKETKSIAFESKTVESSSLTKGKSEITTTGQEGSETLTYKITYNNGRQTDKQLLKTSVTKQPVAQVTTVGTYVAPAPAPAPKQSNCDPNYSGACVPNVYPADVDCAGGSGNGPYYVQGPVYVTGVDRYGLDRDGNGVGCQ